MVFVRRYLVLLLVFLLILLSGCAGPETPAETRVPDPAGDGNAEPVLERFGLDPEEIQRITYSALHFGKRTLDRGDEGFDEALDLLASLRGTPAPLPRQAATRELRLNDGGIPLVLEYDGEQVYADWGYTGEFLLLDGRPDEALEAVFARYAPGPVPEPFTGSGSLREDGPLVLEAVSPVCDGAALRSAVEGSLLRFKEPGPKEGYRSEEGAILRLTAENRGEETIQYTLPRWLLALRDGTWYWVPARMSLGDDLLPRGLAPGETLETSLDMTIFDDSLEPGIYRACMLYSVGAELKAGLTHIAYGEFEIKG